MDIDRAEAENGPADSRRYFLRASLVGFAILAVYFCFHWTGFRDGPPMRDFLGPYTGARCLWRGCNPYDTGQVAREFARAGGLEADHPAWGWEPLVYPPSTLVVLLPVSLLPYHAARVLWYGLSVGLFCWGLLAMAWIAEARCRAWIVLLSAAMLWSEPVELLWNVGQPAAIALGLAMLALWGFLAGRYRIASVIGLGLALGLKPQLAGVALLFLLVQPRLRKSALLSGAFAVGLLLVGGTWLSTSAASRTWRADLPAQVIGSVAPGAVNDPSSLNRGAAQFTNLQADFAVLNGPPRMADAVSYGIGAVLLAAWFWMALRLRDSREGMLVALAALVCIGLLPVYHREYDLVLLAASFPGLIWLVRERRASGLPALAITTLLLLVSPHLRHGWVRFASGAQAMQAVPDERLRTVLLLRPIPWLVLALALVYLMAMLREVRKVNANVSTGRDSFLLR